MLMSGNILVSSSIMFLYKSIIVSFNFLQYLGWELQNY
jgi:hypothetical protein